MSDADFAERLRAALDYKGWKPIDLARAVATSEAKALSAQGNISRILNRKRKVPTYPTVKKWAAALGVRVDWLYQGEGSMLEPDPRAAAKAARPTTEVVHFDIIDEPSPADVAQRQEPGRKPGEIQVSHAMAQSPMEALESVLASQSWARKKTANHDAAAQAEARARGLRGLHGTEQVFWIDILEDLFDRFSATVVKEIVGTVDTSEDDEDDRHRSKRPPRGGRRR